jgi:hypothetical protein
MQKNNQQDPHFNDSLRGIIKQLDNEQLTASREQHL